MVQLFHCAFLEECRYFIKCANSMPGWILDKLGGGNACNFFFASGTIDACLNNRIKKAWAATQANAILEQEESKRETTLYQRSTAMQRNQIMQRAHQIRRDGEMKWGQKVHFGSCLKLAWSEAKAAARRTSKRFRDTLKAADWRLDEFKNMVSKDIKSPGRKAKMRIQIEDFYWGRIDCPCPEEFDRLDRLVNRRAAG